MKHWRPIIFGSIVGSIPLLSKIFERGNAMKLFWLGVIIGAVVMLLSMTIIAAQAVDEKNRQILYLRRQLKEQADAERNNYENDNNKYTNY